MQHTQSAGLLKRAANVLAGGVSSEFRRYAHPHALFYSHGCGSRIYDVDGNEYLDFTLSQGPLILGHSRQEVLDAVTQYSSRGQLFAGQHMQEIELAEKINAIIPSATLMRFSLDGSEAVHTALRVARAATGRNKFLRFEGHYHGWLDNVSWGFSLPPAGDMGAREDPSVYPWSQGIPPGSRDEFIVIPWNDLDLLRATLEAHHAAIAAVITEPVMCNNGCIEPAPGFLEGMRQLCTRYGIALVFDEVITGFRLGLGGAQQYYGVVPDMAVFAKAMASGYPISAIVGKKEWMSLIEQSKVIHAGTMNAGNPSVAAALATISILESEQPYKEMFRLGRKLMNGLREAAASAGHQLLVQGPGPMFHTGFTSRPSVTDFRDTLQYDKVRLQQFIAALHDHGIRVIGRGLWYVSAAHKEEDISRAIDVSRDILHNLK